MPPRSVQIAKRAIDIASASVGLAIGLPLFGAIAAAMRLTSPSPVFFAQRRSGVLLLRRPGDPDLRPRCTEFTIYKFRTMHVDAERLTGAVLASRNDPRITPIGRWLRRTRLDELPQLWNVLRGDMSLVGPRPERPELLDDLALAIPFFKERMRVVKPGITGLAQVSLGYTGAIPKDSVLAEFRDALANPFDLEEADGALADDVRAKLLFDVAYAASLEDFTTFLWTELTIIAKTPWVMIRGVGR